MQPDATPALDLPLIAAGQAQKHVTLNEALLTLDALVHLAVSSATLAQPPASPAADLRHIVPAGATGAWSAADGKIALWRDGGWAFLTPRAGWTAWVADEGRHRLFDGAQWRPLVDALGVLSRLAVGPATASASTPLAVAGDNTLLGHAGASHRVAVNKNAETDTASLVFQSGFAGQTEVGACGNNDLSIRTSPAAGQWVTRMVVKRGNGHVGVGTDAPAMTMPGSLMHLHAGGAADNWSVLHCTTGAEGGAAQGVIIGNVGGAAALWNYGEHSIILGSNGATRLVILANGDCGIGISAPTCRLHVAGPVRTGQSTLAALPQAATAGAGALVYVTDAAGGAIHAFSDGSAWRRVDTRAVVS